MRHGGQVGKEGTVGTTKECATVMQVNNVHFLREKSKAVQVFVFFFFFIIFSSSFFLFFLFFLFSTCGAVMDGGHRVTVRVEGPA